METPSLVIVGAPHFFSSTTLRPLGPRVTFTASARVFIPLSNPRRASSLKAISLGITPGFPLRESWGDPGELPATADPRHRRTLLAGAFGPQPHLGRLLSLSCYECQLHV